MCRMIFQVIFFALCASTGMSGIIKDRISLTITGSIPSTDVSVGKTKKTYSGDYMIGQGAGDVLASKSRTDAAKYSVLIPYDTFQTNFSGVTNLEPEFVVTGDCSIGSWFLEWSMKDVTIYIPVETKPVLGSTTYTSDETWILKKRTYETWEISSSGIEQRVVELYFNPLEPEQKPYVQIIFKS